MHAIETMKKKQNRTQPFDIYFVKTKMSDNQTFQRVLLMRASINRYSYSQQLRRPRVVLFAQLDTRDDYALIFSRFYRQFATEWALCFYGSCENSVCFVDFILEMF